MTKYYYYELDNLIFKGIIECKEDDVSLLNTQGYGATDIAPPDSLKTWRWVDANWVELPPINNPHISYSDVSIWNDMEGQWVTDAKMITDQKIREQVDLWESIKAKRLEQITNGVLVESTGKVFHTDNLSVIQYSTIAGMASLGTYQPTPWKVMDNSWVMLTVELLKELQIAMSIKTNENYKVAEQHKAAMLQSDNPLDYDYSTGWV